MQIQNEFSKAGESIHLLISIAIYMLVGVIGYYLLEDWNVVDSLYFSSVTYTTVGYGDIGPKTYGGILFTCFYMLAGMSIIGNAVGQIAEEVAESQYEMMKQLNKKLEEQTVQVMDGKRQNLYLLKSKSIGIMKTNCCLRCNTNDNQQPEEPPSSTTSRIPSFIQIFCEALPRYAPLSLPFIIGACIAGARNDWNVVDTFYYIIITMSMVGYGDFSPTTDAFKLYIVFSMPFGVFATGRIVGHYAEAYAKALVVRKEADLFKDGLKESMLILMDSDGDDQVTRLEYLQFMLLAMKKVDREFLNLIDQQFDRLDANRDGNLQKNDIEARVRRSEEMIRRRREEKEEPSANEPSSGSNFRNQFHSYNIGNVDRVAAGGNEIGDDCFDVGELT
eukprot:CAMPEP_0196820784 /NCGR_PEP_ID=MMETSP1362-20130617/76659_1 /TAXON_ID=163516 /ORGANISM="Leptocylindrus danicus, Strain CCMP1856" /LENGTH=389 /DNA_ID=CAMNT_0042199783 /DNA_START=60 /DNA_END=1229 /DNA_ORIENTATION=+